MVRGYVPPSLLGSCYISVNGELIVFGGHGLLGDDNHVRYCIIIILTCCGQVGCSPKFH